MGRDPRAEHHAPSGLRDRTLAPAFAIPAACLSTSSSDAARS